MSSWRLDLLRHTRALSALQEIRDLTIRRVLGHFTSSSGELTTFQCWEDKRGFPHGALGECAPGQHGIACGMCELFVMPSDDGSGVECGGTDILLVVGAAVVSSGILIFG